MLGKSTHPYKKEEYKSGLLQLYDRKEDKK